jgi:hypothetical protein
VNECLLLDSLRLFLGIFFRYWIPNCLLCIDGWTGRASSWC